MTNCLPVISTRLRCNLKQSYGLLAPLLFLAAGAFEFPTQAAAQIPAAQIAFVGVCEIPSATWTTSAGWGNFSGTGGSCTGLLSGVAGTYEFNLTGGSYPATWAANACPALSNAQLWGSIGGHAAYFYGPVVTYSGQALFSLSGSQNHDQGLYGDYNTTVGMAGFVPGASSPLGACGVTGLLHMSFGPLGATVSSGFGSYIYEPISGVTIPTVFPSRPVGIEPIPAITIGSTPAIPSAIYTPAIPSVPVSTPPVPSQSTTTPPVPVPQICTPGNVLCIGPFTIPGQPVTTPGIGSQPVVTTPAIGPQAIPTVGVPSQTIGTPAVPAQSIGNTPAIGPVQLTPDISLEVTLADFSYVWVLPKLGMLTSTGAITQEIPTPFGPIPVTVCADSCPVPEKPGAWLNSGVTVTIVIGSQTYTKTVPIDFSM